MSSTLSELHARYKIQAQWTEQLRINLLKRIKLPTNPLVLEVGSGTGCITTWTASALETTVIGVDIDLPTVQYAVAYDQNNGYAQANGETLPFSTNTFHLIFSHFLLLWTSEPLQILAEMKRCVQPGGWVIAMAEPDYGGRIDFPESLATLGQYQAKSLQDHGAAPNLGRQLRALFSQTGLTWISAGVLGGEWSEEADPNQVSEWVVLEEDLKGYLGTQEMQRFKAQDSEAWQTGERILFTPTFYALGQKAG